jgi:hypothetical protein
LRSDARYIVIVIAGLSLGGCRQADGPVPAPNQTIQEELVDVTRDIQYIASGRDPEAPKYLTDDLRKYTERPTALPVVDELSSRTAQVIGGRDLADRTRMPCAQPVAVGGRPRAERAAGRDAAERRAGVDVGGIGAERAAGAVQVGDVQRAVTVARWA